MGIRSISRLLSISAPIVLKRLIIIAKNISAPKLSFGKSYEMDEMCFFLGSKKNLYWLVYAIEKTQKVMDFRIGKRAKKTLNDIIQRLLLSHVKYIYSDKLIHYQYIIPYHIHKTIRYKTNYIERKHLTIRTHLKRFSRRSICFGHSWIITFSILNIYFWREYKFCQKITIFVEFRGFVIMRNYFGFKAFLVSTVLCNCAFLKPFLALYFSLWYSEGILRKDLEHRESSEFKFRSESDAKARCDYYGW